MKVKAYAKINLTLNITGTDGGFHNLESLVCSVDIFDIIKLKKRKDGKINVVMRGSGADTIPLGSNNAYKAAKAYVDNFNTTGADIIIEKNIPLGAGLGGSSADAAGVLRGMYILYGEGNEEKLKRIADFLGSDTGYMLTGGYALISGRGDKVSPIDCKKTLYGLLLVPEAGVSSGECYKEYDKQPTANTFADGVKELLYGDLSELGGVLHNDLYAAAARLNPSVKRAYEELKSFSPLGVCMTGSGSGVYALFETPEMCAWARSRYKGNFETILFKTV